MEEKLKKQIESLISQYRVMLFMKGTPEQPQCGFSANAVGMLVEAGIYFESFDIYSDENIRQGLKEYSNWPTYPQLYIDGELIGGVDIMVEMFDNGEFEVLKNDKNL